MSSGVVDHIDLELTRLIRVVKVVRHEIAKHIPTDVDPGALPVLFAVVRDGPARQGELADIVVLDPSTISRYVRNLTASGLIERRSDPDDGRAVQLAPTPAGQELTQILGAKRRAVLDTLLEGWPETDLDELHRLIHRLNDSFEVMRRHSARPYDSNTH